MTPITTQSEVLTVTVWREKSSMPDKHLSQVSFVVLMVPQCIHVHNSKQSIQKVVY